MPSVLGELALRGMRGDLGAPSHTAFASPPSATPRRPMVAAAAGLIVLGLAGCGSSDFASASLTTTNPTSGPATASAKAKARPTTSATEPTTSTLGPLPQVVSSSSSPVDANVITALGDLPAAFGCPKVPEPIVIPASGSIPAAIVCHSSLAGEAVFLWYAGDPDTKYLAGKAAMDKARIVHAGRRWVAGGMVNPGMGSVGGDVFKK